MWLKWHWFVVIGLGTFACGPHVDSAFELVTFKVRTQVKFDIFLKVVQVGGSHDLTKNRCIFNKTRRSWLSGNWTFIFSFCPHDLSVNHLNRTPLWSLQRQKPKLHWYQISLWRVWTKNKDTCIILLFSCLLHIYIYYIHINSEGSVYASNVFSQTNQWLRVTDSFGARSHGDFSSALERSALEKFRAETMLGGSFIAVVKARGDKPKDGTSPWQQDCNIAFVSDYPISDLEWKWNMMLHSTPVIIMNHSVQHQDGTHAPCCLSCF